MPSLFKTIYIRYMRFSPRAIRYVHDMVVDGFTWEVNHIGSKSNQGSNFEIKNNKEMSFRSHQNYQVTVTHKFPLFPFSLYFIHHSSRAPVEDIDLKREARAITKLNGTLPLLVWPLILRQRPRKEENHNKRERGRRPLS